MIGKDISI